MGIWNWLLSKQSISFWSLTAFVLEDILQMYENKTQYAYKENNFNVKSKQKYITVCLRCVTLVLAKSQELVMSIIAHLYYVSH